MSNELNQDLGRDSGPGEHGVPAVGALVVGLDAGGTRTRAVLASAADGRPLGEGVAGPGNALTVPVPQLTEHLVEALARAVPESDRPGSSPSRAASRAPPAPPTNPAASTPAPR